LRLSAEDLLDLAISAQRENLAISIQRQRFRDAVVRAAYALYTRGELLGIDEKEFGTDLLAIADNRKQLDNCWKSVNPTGLVRSLLTQRTALARAADGVLTEGEQARLLRPRAAADAWTAHDLPLLDEAEALVKAAPRRFGHVVVDEAQDLSPMQLRMLARRARHHSMTVLGDLAQATGPASPGAWEETLVHLGRPGNAQRAELTMGYRLPGSILELANRLLPEAAPDVAASQSVRESGDPPDFHEFGAEELLPGVVEHALALAKEFTTVAVIAEDARIPELRDAIEARGIVLGELGETSPDYPLVVVPATLAKGLEFDAVLLVEPAEIMAREPHGVRLLFVGLTRAVQHLGVAYVTPVPAALRH
jgi:DNA helicase IV